MSCFLLGSLFNDRVFYGFDCLCSMICVCFAGLLVDRFVLRVCLSAVGGFDVLFCLM